MNGTTLRMDEDRIATLCDATDAVRQSLTQLPFDGAQVEREVRALESLRESALSVRPGHMLPLEEDERRRAEVALLAHRDDLLDQDRFDRAAEVEQLRREVAEDES